MFRPLSEFPNRVIDGFGRFSEIVKVTELMGDIWQSRGDRIANGMLPI